MAVGATAVMAAAASAAPRASAMRFRTSPLARRASAATAQACAQAPRQENDA